MAAISSSVDRARDLRHRRVVAAALARLVLAQRLDEVILTLCADPPDLIVAGHVGIVAEAAAMALHRGAPALEPGRHGPAGGRNRRRELGDRLREQAQVVVGEIPRQLVHRRRDALPLAKLVELDQDEVGRLTAEGRNLGSVRGPVLAMAGEARRKAFGERLGMARHRPAHEHGGQDGTQDQHGRRNSERGAPAARGLTRHSLPGRPRH